MLVSFCCLRLSISTSGAKATSADATSAHATHTAAPAPAAAAAPGSPTAGPGTPPDTTAAADDDDADDAAGYQISQAACAPGSSRCQGPPEPRCPADANAAEREHASDGEPPGAWACTSIS